VLLVLLLELLELLFDVVMLSGVIINIVVLVIVWLLLNPGFECLSHTVPLNAVPFFCPHNSPLPLLLALPVAYLMDVK